MSQQIIQRNPILSLKKQFRHRHQRQMRMSRRQSMMNQRINHRRIIRIRHQPPLIHRQTIQRIRIRIKTNRKISVPSNQRNKCRRIFKIKST